MIRQCLLASIFGVVVNLGFEAQADILQYTFTGMLPAGSSSHSQIADGETFTATFLIDDSVPNTSSVPEIELYSAAVISGSVQFSGGYGSSLNYAGYDVQIADD